MQHLLRETSSVVQQQQEILQQAGGKRSEGSWVAQIVSLLIFQVQQMSHLRPVMAAVTDPLVVSGDCDQTGLSQTTNCHRVLLKKLPLIIISLVPGGRNGITSPECLVRYKSHFLQETERKPSAEHE